MTVVTLWHKLSEKARVAAQRVEAHRKKLLSELKMTGGTPKVRSDKSLTLLTFDI